MARRSSGWLGGLLGGLEAEPVDRFSIENLRLLRDVLVRNPVVTDSNRDAVVETLRSIAELTIWGDQHDQKFLDFFLENNILQHFTHILQQKANRRGDVAIQVLQTLSMLIQVSSLHKCCACHVHSQNAVTVITTENRMHWQSRYLYRLTALKCAEHSEQNSNLLPVQQQLHQ